MRLAQNLLRCRASASVSGPSDDSSQISARRAQRQGDYSLLRFVLLLESSASNSSARPRILDSQPLR